MPKYIILNIMIGATLLFSQCKPAFDIKNANSVIFGAWAKKEDENVEFVITKKNIEYFESGYSFNYKIEDDKDFIISDSNKVVLKFKIINLSKDSLIIQSKNDGNKGVIYRYYKR